MSIFGSLLDNRGRLAFATPNDETGAHCDADSVYAKPRVFLRGALILLTASVFTENNSKGTT